MSNAPNNRTRLRVTRVEDRITPSTYNVTEYDTWDKNTVGTLPWAVDQANNNAGFDQINFVVGMNQAKSINIVDTLSLTDGVIITGAMQAGSSLTLKVKKAFVFDTPTAKDATNQIIPQTYEVQGVTFDHCQGENGAAFEVTASNTVTTRNCLFTDNKAVGPNNGTSDGGAVCVRSGGNWCSAPGRASR